MDKSGYSNFQTKSVFLTFFFILMLTLFWATSPKTYNDILPKEVTSNTPDIQFVVDSKEAGFEYLNLITPHTNRDSLNSDKIAVFVETGNHLDKIQWHNRNYSLINNVATESERRSNYEYAKVNRSIEHDYINQTSIFIILIFTYICIAFLIGRKKSSK